MNCIEFEAVIERTVETRGPLVATAVAHASTCSGCQSALNLSHQLDAAIVAWRLTRPPAGLADAVLLELTKTTLDAYLDEMRHVDDSDWAQTAEEPVSVRTPIPQTARPNRRSAAVAMASVAACLFIAVFATFYSEARPNSPGDKLSLTQKNRPVVITREESPFKLSRALTTVLSNLRTEYNDITNETTSAAHEIVNAIPQRVAESVIPDADEFELLPDASDVSRMWQPIGSRVESALGFLLQAVPSQVPSG